MSAENINICIALTECISVTFIHHGMIWVEDMRGPGRERPKYRLYVFIDPIHSSLRNFVL